MAPEQKQANGPTSQETEQYGSELQLQAQSQHRSQMRKVEVAQFR